MAEIRQHSGNIAWANLSGVGNQSTASTEGPGRQYVEVIQRFAELANGDTDQPDPHLRHQRGEQASSTLPELLCRFIVGMVRK